MNERVMQFRLGMFVIVAGLVLTMLIIWFGESPSLFREQGYLTVHFHEAPGVAEGIPVRKSGIRIGEVAAVEFDQRASRPDDGVLVTLAIDRRKVKLQTGSAPRVSRALIGDVSIDMMPGSGPGYLRLHPTPAIPPDPEIIEGTVAADPSKAIEAASQVMQDVQGTLLSIKSAAEGINTLSKKAEGLDTFLTSWTDMGKSVATLSNDFDRVVKANEGNLQPAISNFRQVAEKFNAAFDPETQASLKTGLNQFASASARLDQVLADFQPMAKDLGAPPSRAPVTNFGQLIGRMNRVAYDLALLTRALEDGRGGLNTRGSLQKLFTQSDLHDNLNQMATSARDTFDKARPAINNLNIFAEKVGRDPASMMRGAFR
jgi:phospholipid/cholesterol/gamma-HCH transport system substrate-binding protein